MLAVHHFSVSFTMYSFGLRVRCISPIRDLALSVSAGEVVAVIGQSGGGKSLLAHALLGLLPSNACLSGELFFEGKLLAQQDLPRLRGREIALIPQSVGFLNPLQRVGRQIIRAAELSGMDPGRAHRAAWDAVQRYRLDERAFRSFPFQLSGGMARRVLTATATIGGAKLLLADEPTNGLDRETAQETLAHIRELADAGKGVVLISHNIEEVLTVADQVAVLCGGVTVEQSSAEVFRRESGLHPYSRALLRALPQRDFIAALPPASKDNSAGCPFVNQCDQRDRECVGELPSRQPTPSGWVRCCRYA